MQQDFYKQYTEIVELIANTLQVRGAETTQLEIEGKEAETADEAEMYNLLDTAYELLIRANAMLKNEDNYTRIDENHPLYDGENKRVCKHALSSINLDFIRNIAER